MRSRLSAPASPERGSTPNMSLMIRTPTRKAEKSAARWAACGPPRTSARGSIRFSEACERRMLSASGLASDRTKICQDVALLAAAVPPFSKSSSANRVARLRAPPSDARSFSTALANAFEKRLCFDPNDLWTSATSTRASRAMSRRLTCSYEYLENRTVAFCKIFSRVASADRRPRGRPIACVRFFRSVMSRSRVGLSAMTRLRIRHIGLAARINQNAL